MNTLSNFTKYSKQFNVVADTLFNNSYKLDHFAIRSFDIKTMIDKYEKKDYTLEKDVFIIDYNVKSYWMSNNKLKNFNESNESQYGNRKFSRPKMKRCEFPYIFISNVSPIPLDTVPIYEKDKYNKIIEYYKNPINMDFDFYSSLSKTDNILAWTLLFNNSINHLAFQVPDINECLEKVKKDLPQFEINNPENPIEISQDNNLMQFSLKAERVPYKFRCSMRYVPYTFIEFVERKNGRRGFELQNAKGIFKSTEYNKLQY